jgi:raffinose/stachyose/melibiose transport system substrate-binding protein
MFKRFRWTSLLSVVVVALAACGSPAASTPTGGEAAPAATAAPAADSGAAAPAATAAPAAANSGPITLRYFTYADAPAQEKLQVVLEDYKQANPNIDIKLESVAGSGAAVYPDVLRTSIASGDPPDLFWMWGGSIASPFIDAGQVLDLGPYYEQYGWSEKLAPWTIDRVTRDGKIWGVPRTGRGMGFYYRTDLFEQYGLSVPTSYAELEQLCATLKENDIYCASVGGKFGWHTMRILDYFIETNCGPEKHDQLNALEARWDDPCVVQSYTNLKKWVDEGWLVPDFLNVAPSDARLPVYQGNAAMILEGPWFEEVLKNDEQDTATYDFFLPPTGHEPLRYSAFPEQFMIPKDSQNPDAAAALINWWISSETATRHMDIIGVSSATTGVAPDCNEWRITCKWREIVTTSTDTTYPPTDQAFDKELMDGFFEIQDGMVAGQFSPEEGAQQMQQYAEAWKAKSP